MSTLPGARTECLRVLQVIGNAIVGGMETFVARLCEHLQRSGRFEIVCLCPYESAATDVLRRLGCVVHVAPLPEEPAWRGIEYASALVVEEEIDIIHAHLTNAHLLAGIVGRMTGTPVLATIHGREVQTADLAMQRLADTHLHVVSRATYYQALAVGAQRPRTTCITNGVDADRFKPGVPSGALRRACGIPPGAPLIGFVGRMSHEKGPDLFVRAAAAALACRPDAHAVMLGAGTMLEAMRELALELGVGERLHLPGSRDDIVDCLRELTLLVSSSRSEGTPLATTEALAVGIPVVATHVGGTPEIVTMGESGVLVAPGDTDALADVAVALLDQPDDLARLGAEARRRMIGRFSLAARNAEVAQLLESLVPATADVRPSSRRTPLTSVKANGSKLRPRNGVPDLLGPLDAG